MSSTTTITHLDQKEARASLSASSSSTLCTLTDASPFNASRTLHVDARGIGAFRLPLPPSQTEITITDPDGSESYTSTRASRWSGNSILSHPKLGNLIRTDYFFGPNRDPVLCLLQTTSVLAEQVKVTGKWMSRSARFMMPTGTDYEWFYAKEKSAEGKKMNLIVLRALSGSNEGKEKGKDDPGDRLVARLVRSPDTRTPGTSKCSAGNGGELQMDDGAMQALQLDESVIVATCLVMLKREIDRRRVIQAAVIGGGAGG